MNDRYAIDTTGWLCAGDFHDGPATDRNERTKPAVNLLRCAFCGNPVKETDPYHVEFTTCGLMVPALKMGTVPSEGEVNAEGKRGSVESQGSFVIGSSCARKVRGYAVRQSMLEKIQATLNGAK